MKKSTKSVAAKCSSGQTIVVFSAILLAIAAFLPWGKALDIGVKGIEGDGMLTIGIAVFALILSLIRRGVPLATLIVGVVGFIIGARGYFAMSQAVAEFGSVGTGLYLTILASLGIIVGAVVQMGEKRKTAAGLLSLMLLPLALGLFMTTAFAESHGEKLEEKDKQAAEEIETKYDDYKEYDEYYEKYAIHEEGDEGLKDDEYEDEYEEDDKTYDEWKDGEFDDAAISFYDFRHQIKELFYILDDISAVREEYKALEVDIPIDINAALDSLATDAKAILDMPGVDELYDDVKDVIEHSEKYIAEGEKYDYLEDSWEADDLAEVEAVLLKLEEFWAAEPEVVIEAAWQNLDGQNFSEDIITEVDNTLAEIAVAEKFLDAVEKITIEREDVLKKIANLRELIAKAKTALEKIREKLVAGIDDPKEMDKYWDIVDHTGQKAFNDLRHIVKFFDKHEKLRAQLEEAIPEVLKEVREWLEEFEPEDNNGKFKEYYGDIEKEYDYFVKELTKNLKQELYDEIMHKLPKNIMEAIAPSLGDEVAKEIISKLMNGLNVFGEDLTKDFLSDQAEVLKDMDFDPDKAKFAKDKIKDLMKQIKKTVVPKKFRKDLKDLLKGLRTMIEIEAGKEQFETQVKLIEEMLKEISKENVFGDEAIEFYDVKFDDADWYWEPVMTTKHKGIVDGYGDGNFGPNNPVTYAEALKMIMLAKGYEVPKFDDKEEWYKVYLTRLDELALKRLNGKNFANWNAAASRGDIVMMVNEIFGIELSDYVDGTFPDVKADDALAKDAMASYLAGIFTGEGGTGKLNPNSTINRAAFTKVINAALKYLEENSLVDELSEIQ